MRGDYERSSLTYNREQCPDPGVQRGVEGLVLIGDLSHAPMRIAEPLSQSRQFSFRVVDKLERPSLLHRKN